MVRAVLSLSVVLLLEVFLLEILGCQCEICCVHMEFACVSSTSVFASAPGSRCHVVACRSSYVVEPGLDLCLRCGAVLLLIGQRGVAGDVVNVADVDVVSRAFLSFFGSCCSMLSVFLSLAFFVRTVLFVRW